MFTTRMPTIFVLVSLIIGMNSMVQGTVPVPMFELKFECTGERQVLTIPLIIDSDSTEGSNGGVLYEVRWDHRCPSGSGETTLRLEVDDVLDFLVIVVATFRIYDNRTVEVVDTISHPLTETPRTVNYFGCVPTNYAAGEAETDSQAELLKITVGVVE